MTKLVYRGVAYDTDQIAAHRNATEQRVIRRPQLVYRGVAHNGVRTIEPTPEAPGVLDLIYRGFRTA